MHFSRLKNRFTLDFPSYCHLVCAFFPLLEWQRAARNLQMKSELSVRLLKWISEGECRSSWHSVVSRDGCVCLSEQSYWEGTMLTQNDIQHCYFSNKPWHTGPAEEVQWSWALAVAGQHKCNKIRTSFSWVALAKEYTLIKLVGMNFNTKWHQI